MAITAPTDLSGLDLWLNAPTLGLADGAAVSSWTDSSGNARHATQGTAGLRPTYQTAELNGLGVVRFDGADDRLVTPSMPLPAAVTWFVVAKCVYPPVGGEFLHTDTGSVRHLILRQQGMGYWLNGFASTPTGSTIDTMAADPFVWNILTCVRTATDMEVFVNQQGDGPTALAGTANSGTDVLTLGGRVTSWTGDVAEVVCYDRVLSGTERNDVELYLAAKYAIALYVATADERMPALTTAQLTGALAINISRNEEWQFQAAAECGFRHARIHPGWGDIEAFGSPPSTVAAALESPLAWCATYGLTPMVVAGYGPSVESAGTWTVASTTAAGATVVPVVEAVAAIDPPRCHVQRTTGVQIVPQGRWAYYGAIVHAVDTGARTLTLGAATSVELVAGDLLRVWRLKYASCVGEDPADASVVAFRDYMLHLAARIVAHGLTGDVEIWNEPPWANDAWDVRYRFYDADPPPAPVEVPEGGMNWGFPRSLLDLAGSTPAGVHYVSAFVNKSGSNSLLSDRFNTSYPAISFTEAEAEATVYKESFHPYHHIPEGHGWDPRVPGYTAALEGASPGSNFKTAAWLSAQHQNLNGWTVRQEITEVGGYGGDFWNTGTPGTEVQKARGYLRILLYYAAAGMERVYFWLLAESAGNSGFMNRDTREEYQAYTAFQGLANDLDALAVAPLAFDDDDLPQVTAVAGETFPVMSVPVAGRADAADPANVYLLNLWQRSTVPDPDLGASPFWHQIGSPGAATVTVRLPAGYVGATARNLVTRAFVSVASLPPEAGRSVVTLPVADDPIALRVTETVPAVMAEMAMFRRSEL